MRQAGALILLCLSMLTGGPALPEAQAQRIVRTPPLIPIEPPATEFVLVDAFPEVEFPFRTDRIVGLAVPPGATNELFITGQSGRVLVITNLLAPTRTVFLDLSADTYSEGESGLLGLAFHPNYRVNRQFYVYYTRTNREISRTFITLSRFVSDPANPHRALPDSEQVLFAQADRDPIHQAGDIHFGPDGYLYVPIGDEGAQNDPYRTSQRIDGGLFSGILRLDVDGRAGSLAPNPHPSVGTGYWIPPDNPFIGATTFLGRAVRPEEVRTEFWAVGLRNPHRIHFDRQTGELYAGDVGGTRREEVNRIVRGGNYGWVHFEGSLTNEVSPYGPPPAGMVHIPPLYEYTRSGGDPNLQGQAVIGGVVVRGTNYPSLTGKYVFGDYVSAHLWSMTFQGAARPVVTKLLTADYGPTGFGFHPGTGEVLVVQRNGGRISRLIRATGEGTTLPPTLSETGVFASLAGLVPRAGMEPYDVASPFWSDHAIKRRWFFFQDATSTIRRDGADQWTFPAGTVWVKHFDIEQIRGNPTTRRRLETRFLVKSGQAAHGFTYRWREDNSDADLVPDEGLNEELYIEDAGAVRTQIWRYPGRSECLICHNGAAGYALGFSTRQLNLASTRNGTPVNQLIHLSQLGALQPPVTDPASMPRLVALEDSTADLEHRFRSYLDANCAYCHRDGGVGRGNWDARYEIPFGSSGIINGPVTEDLGIDGARMIRPGDFRRSILWQRIAQSGAVRMPPLATDLIHNDAVDLLQQFITGSTYIVARHLFYNASAFDGDDPSPNAADDRAIAINKEVLFAGRPSTLGNISSYPRGINGLMLDIWRLPALPLASDIRVRVGNDDRPAGWAAGPAPSSITLRRAAGVAGSDRVTLLWPDGSISDRWVEVSLLPSPRTGIQSADTFYIGSSPGDTLDDFASPGVTSNDLIRVRMNPRSALNPAPITSPFDINRDRRVDSLDQAAIRMFETRGPTLRLIDLSPVP
ncbi:MAG: PQQ-dependent sugar dehydrogenase [Verrucomicrobiae bacterium]|nr:PQQ-dependent sugar dehydrogenase [Verrucomicrobiae bacterium]